MDRTDHLRRPRADAFGVTRAERRARLVRLTLWLAAAAWPVTGWTAGDEEEDPSEECKDCHYDADDTDEVEFRDGSKVSAFVDSEKWSSSVHGKELGCVDCHRNIGEYPHPELTAGDLRSYQIEQAATCSRCHYAYYTRVLDGIHYKQLAKGQKDAPTCVDCHGAHDTRPPGAPRITIDRRCAKCHAEVSQAYERSVHGKALLEAGSGDVPVCTDCHGAHAIADPNAPQFHVNAHKICARCHVDAERMEPYDLSTNVLDSYLDDFHGMSNALYAAGAGTPDKPIATCVDCHGVHDIQPFDHSGTKNDVRRRIADMCRRCHEEVPEGFADAWLSHYEPTLASAPLVWGIRWIYRIMIPLILVGLVLHILLHLWAVRAQRYGRE